MTIKKGDTVKVITGADKGKSGKVLAIHCEESRIVVEGINIRKIHKKKSGSKPGEIIEVPGAVHISNVKKAE